jgi:hypothetical protein
MLHTVAELRHRAEQCRNRASEAGDGEVRAEMLELARAFDEEAASVELEGTYEEGYQEGWSSVAGADPLPRTPTEPLEGEERTAQKGYIYGCSDAKEANERSLSHQGSNP